MKELFENYISECTYVSRLRPATIKIARYAFDHFLKTMPEVRHFGDASTVVLTTFFMRLQTRERLVGKGQKAVGVKDTTILTYARPLKTFFKWLRRHGHIDSNPFDDLKLPSPDFADKRALSGDQIKRLMGAVAQHAKSPFLLRRDMAMIGVLTFCGVRRNELLFMETKDVDLHTGFITVQSSTSKSRRTRKIPVNIHLRMHLEEYLAERKKRGCRTPYLFVSHGADRGLSHHGVRHWVQRLERASGVRFHLHRFRHTFATNLAMQDVGAVKIQKLMGHTDLKMTQTYLRSVSAEEMRDDVNKLSFDNIA